MSTPTPKPIASMIAGVTALASGGYHSCAIHDGRKLSCWGYNDAGQLGLGDGASTDIYAPELVPQMTDVEKVTLGEKHTCVLRTSGSVYCWGINFDGQLGIGALGGHNTPQQVRW
jgi:alpha-tubulin suppressor-like RCC1 family protein